MSLIDDLIAVVAVIISNLIQLNRGTTGVINFLVAVVVVVGDGCGFVIAPHNCE